MALIMAPVDCRSSIITYLAVDVLLPEPAGGCHASYARHVGITDDLTSLWRAIMDINRRTLLTSGTTLAGFSVLTGEAMAQGAKRAGVPKGGVILTAMVKAKQGQEDAVKEALLALVEPTRREPGCLCYNLHQSKSDPTQFMFYEQWVSKEAMDSHVRTPHMSALGAKLKDRTTKAESSSTSCWSRTPMRSGVMRIC
jgi:quinol monooxygenase YgiN